MLNDDRKTTEEAYISATSSSDLRCDTRDGAPRSATDLLIAAGLTPGILGAALVRLQSEWDCAAKPSRLHPSRIPGLANAMPRTIEVNGARVATTDKQRLEMAHEAAEKWFQTELSNLRQRLKSLAKVQDGLAKWADKAGIAHPERAARSVIAYWLDSTCHHCHGRGADVIVGTPTLGRQCRHCKGSGKAREPMGQEGRRMLNMMDEAVHVAKQSMKKRLQMY